MNKSSRNVPTLLKRKVLIESGHRCAIPQCGHSGSLDIHHITPWSECKKHDFENLIALCPNCHRLVHDGKIDKKSLFDYKKNVFYRDYASIVPNNSNDLNLDRSTYKKLIEVIPTDLYRRFKLSGFGDHKTMDILQPLYDFISLCDDPVFVFKNEEFESGKKSLLSLTNDAVNYINPFLQRDNNGEIRIGPTEGSLGCDTEAMDKWSSILGISVNKMYIFFERYNDFIVKLRMKVG